MRLSELVDASRRVSDLAGRKAKIEVLAALLVRLPREDVPVAVPYLTGSTRQGRLGVGPAALSRAAAVAASAAPELHLRDVDGAFETIAGLSGAGSATRRGEILAGLASRATGEEQRFLVRLLAGELRQGADEGLVLDAVARAAEVDAGDLRRAAMLAGELPPVAAAVLADGPAALAAFSVTLFRPLSPMLAQTAEDVDEALGYLPDASVEYKLDGARVQVHKAGDDVRLFSRQGNDVTVAAPEIVEAVRRLPARELILDGEAIALRPDGTPHPFQATMRRFGRKLDVERLRAELPLTPVFFDILRRDGQDMLGQPHAERFAALRQTVPVAAVVPYRRVVRVEDAREFLDAALARGHEGIMAKGPDSPYEAGGRGRSWLKVKPALTLDLVVLAAEWGHGRRKGLLSNLHLGARDPDRGGFVMLGKTFKGLTDEMLAWQTREILARDLGRDASTVHARPELVVEIAFNDVQVSPRYPGGLALRFARVKRYRPDKEAGAADTMGAVREIFARRTGLPAPAGSDDAPVRT